MYIIFLIYLATVFASSHGKYIDLLPEEEKQEFLDRVARRIMENVKTKLNATTSSEDVSDEQLKKHNEFVKKIIKEESKQIEIDKNDKIHNKDNIEENLDVIPLRTVQREDDSNADTVLPVDLTVSDDQRRSYVELSKEKNNDGISIDVNNNISSIQKRSVQVNVTNNDFLDKQTMKQPDQKGYNIDELKPTAMDTNSPLTTEANDIKSNTASVKLNHNLQKEIKDENVTEVEKERDLVLKDNITEEIVPATETFINVSKIKVNTSVMNDFKAKAHNNKVTDKTIIHIKTITEKSAAKNHENNKNNSRGAIFLQNNTNANVSKEGIINIQIKDNRNLTPKITYTKSNYQIKVKDSTFSSILTDEGTTETIKKTTYNNMQQTHNKISNIIKNVSKNNTKSITVIDAKPTDNILTISALPKSIPNVLHKKDIKKAKVKLPSNPKDSKLLSDIASKALKKVKEKYKRKDSKAEEYKRFIDSQIKPGKEKTKFAIKHYRIYEVDLPRLSKNLLRDHKPMIDQPYYVPVYEYSPNKAYFNPENRYGPNAIENEPLHNIYLLRDGDEGNKTDDNVDDNDDTIDEGSESKSDFKTHVKKFALYHTHTTRPPNKLSSTTIKRKKHKKPKPDHHTSNSDEDTSEEIHFPDSYEHLHPYNNMKSGMKSHIKAIREILNNNGIFGEIHHKNKDKYIEYLNEIKRHKKLLRSNKNEIFQFDIGGYNIIIRKTDDDEIDHNKIKKGSFKNILKHINSKRVGNETKINTISKIIGVTDEKDVFVNLEKLKDINIKFIRRNNDMKLQVYLKAVKDLIDGDSEALKQYDWLSTTVQIQSALAKLKDLLQRLRESKPIHPSDVQILKYMIFLHSLSLEIRGVTDFGNKLRKKSILPKPKNKKQRWLLKKKALFDRVWLFARTRFLDGIAKLEEFVFNIENGLYDLHDALKNIAMITKYGNQNWYGNLRDLYLTTDKKHLNEILLHLSVSRLIGLIEKSCEDGLEEDFIRYMKNHRKEGKNTLDETMFILRILDEVKN